MQSPEQSSGVRIAARIGSCLSAAAREVAVADVRIGLGYTAVLLADGRTGVAYTFRDEARGGCSVFTGLRPLSGRPAADLLALLESHDAIEAGVGLACANALANRNEIEHLKGDILEHLDVRPKDDVAMVGYFGPLVKALRKRSRSLTIFERVAAPTELLRPQEEALAALPRCQIVLLTATSIINHTLDGLLDAARGCRQVAVLGPSTPLLAEAFSTTGVTLLSGVVVIAADEVLRVVSEGGGMRQFSRHVRKVSTKAGTLAPTFERSIP
ncbi:MAG: DUF364 domain-containing protein [Gemmatimonadales bacterium]|jgi:uncharacterized protein|nr:DUF364 domain-containing protein [Gemmatimonadales bacterium]